MKRYLRGRAERRHRKHLQDLDELLRLKDLLQRDRRIRLRITEKLAHERPT